MDLTDKVLVDQRLDNLGIGGGVKVGRGAELDLGAQGLAAGEVEADRLAGLLLVELADFNKGFP